MLSCVCVSIKASWICHSSFFFFNTSGFNEGIPLLCLAEQNRGVENHSRTQKRLLTHEMEQHSDTGEVHVSVCEGEFKLTYQCLSLN